MNGNGNGNGSGSSERVVVIGGGPAGLTAAYELTRRQIKPVVIEKLDKVGGIARTENYKGYHFDMGGHRFFTKTKEVDAFWHEVLGNEFLRRPRLSRIYYQHKFFPYPLKPVETLAGLGIVESILIILSYLRWQIFPYREEESVEQWVTNRFGKRLYLTFFKSYTEKVWGIPCSELKAEWAAQRIKGLSMRTAVINMFYKPKKMIKTLIEQFDYPRRGPGMLWTMVKDQIEERGAVVKMNTSVVAIHRDQNRITGVEVRDHCGTEVITGNNFLSSMPVAQFLQWLTPPPPPEVLEAAANLRYRDFLTVCLVINREHLFDDNWIYIHEPAVQVGRIQNFKNWSPDMVPDQSKTSLGLEYFCNEGDALWTMADADLIELGKRELDRIGLASYAEVEDGAVFRVEKTYPVYDSEYTEHLAVIKEYLATLENFQTIGRNGLHRYNNQDHAMLTGMLAVRNLLDAESHNLWLVNAEDEYHEEVYEDAESVPQEVVEAVQEALTHVFPKLDPVAFGVAVGAVAGLALSLATLFLIIKGGVVIGPNLALLSQFLPGYSVTPAGAALALVYGFALGLIGGWAIAFMRNAVFAAYLAGVHRHAEQSVLSAFWDYV
jgi:protoporphyrinogen oxidase